MNHFSTVCDINWLLSYQFLGCSNVLYCVLVKDGISIWWLINVLWLSDLWESFLCCASGFRLRKSVSSEKENGELVKQIQAFPAPQRTVVNHVLRGKETRGQRSNVSVIIFVRPSQQCQVLQGTLTNSTSSYAKNQNWRCIGGSLIKHWNSFIKIGLFNNSSLLLSQTTIFSAYSWDRNRGALIYSSIISSSCLLAKYP